MKIKNLFISLILIMVSVLVLSACGGNPPPSGPENWFAESELSKYGLSNLPVPDASNFENALPENGNYLLYLTATVNNQTSFEQYVQSVVNYLNQNYPNTVGYRDGFITEIPNKTYTGNRITKSNILYSFNTAGNSESVYEIYYTSAPLSNETCYVQYGNNSVAKVKLWDYEKTYHITLKYYAQNIGSVPANTITFDLTQPNASIVRYYSLFDDAIESVIG